MLSLVLVPERSIARNICPTSPSGLIGRLKPTLPPRSTCVLRSKDGVTAPFFALVERMHQNTFVLTLNPPIKRLPFEATSRVPHCGEFGMLTGFNQVTPPSMERENCLPPKLLPPVLHAWY